MRTGSSTISFIALAILMTAANSLAIEYKEYKRTRLLTEYFELQYDRDEVTITAFADENSYMTGFPRSSLVSKDGLVYVDDDVLFDESGLLIDGHHFSFDSISDSRITQSDDAVNIMFYKRKDTASNVSRLRAGNLIAVGESVTVESDEFIRGIVLAVAGDIEVLGEVNKDIVAILGDVYVGPDAVARGDIAAVGGRVDMADEASVYGEVYNPDRRVIRRRHRFAYWDNPWDMLEALTYDRVDGLGLYLGVRYQDPDSLLPTFSVMGGYAFNSEHWRFHFGLEQCVLRRPAIVVGGAIYRKLATGDSWLIGDRENSAFALLATEDFRDYYEAEGGSIYVRAVPYQDVTVETGYRFEETNWLDARRHLWSMFGGSKLFSENFSTVDQDFRLAGIAELDTTANAVWYNRVDWDTRSKDDPFERSAWHVTADFEWSSNSFNSDFDYRRYTLAVRRYQRVHRRAMVIARAMAGNSDGYLPMYKRFFLGGLGTLRGYDHKEYMGTRFWLANTEYRIKFPRFESAIAVFWDIGQIANDRKLDSSVDIKNNLGLALYIDDDFKVSLAKRLDRSYDDDPIFYVRLDHLF